MALWRKNRKYSTSEYNKRLERGHRKEPETEEEAKTRMMELLIQNPDLANAELCRRSFFHFMKEFWGEISPEEPKWNWHIPYLCGELQQIAERVARREPAEYDLIINIPPGTTKSTTCTVMFPTWCWTNWPWMQFIAASYSGALSLEHSVKSRDIVKSEKFSRLFPGMSVKLDKDTKTNFAIIYEDKEGKPNVGGSRFATSVGGSVTGFHGHILIVDDPLNPEQAVSTIELQKANDWLDQTLSTRKIDKAIVPTILIMQRLHQNDPTGHFLEKGKTDGKKIRHICLPGELNGFREFLKPESLADYYIEGMLDPVRMPLNVLEDMEINLGQYGYAAQVGQNPVPAGGGMFKVDMFPLMEPNWLHPNMILSTVRYWDKAGTEGGKGAMTSGTKMHLLRNKKFCISDVKSGRWGTDEREAIIRSTAEADGPRVEVWVEQEPGSGGKESAQSTIRNLAGFRVFAERPTGDKVYRADPYSVQVNSGNVILLKGPWNSLFIEEHKYFPVGKLKDMVDSSSGAFTKLALRKVARVLD
jgi:predicted phage terminase large subunit-like protein